MTNKKATHLQKSMIRNNATEKQTVYCMEVCQSKVTGHDGDFSGLNKGYRIWCNTCKGLQHIFFVSFHRSGTTGSKKRQWMKRQKCNVVPLVVWHDLLTPAHNEQKRRKLTITTIYPPTYDLETFEKMKKAACRLPGCKNTKCTMNKKLQQVCRKHYVQKLR